MVFTILALSSSKIRLPKQALKEHPDRQIRQIAESIKAYGFNDPVAIDENNEVIEGVGRILAARQLGLKKIPVIQLNHLSEAQKKAYRIAHNKICLNTGFNLEALRVEFEALSQLDETLLTVTGFESAELHDLLHLPDLPVLGPELTESLSMGKTMTCPHCGGIVHVS